MQDKIGPDAFDEFLATYSEAKRTITQFLLDCDLRAVVMRYYHPDFTEIDVLNAIKLGHDGDVAIMTNRRPVWQNAATALFLERRTTYTHLSHLHGELIDQMRSNVLVIDVSDNENHRYRDIASEFPKIVLYHERPEWHLLGHALFPTMPHPLSPRLLKDVPDIWKAQPLYMFAPFYNVCLFPELVINNSLKHAEEWETNLGS